MTSLSLPPHPTAKRPSKTIPVPLSKGQTRPGVLIRKVLRDGKPTAAKAELYKISFRQVQIKGTDQAGSANYQE